MLETERSCHSDTRTLRGRELTCVLYFWWSEYSEYLVLLPPGVQTVRHLVCVLSKQDRRTEPLAPGPEPCFKGSICQSLVQTSSQTVGSGRVFSRVTVNRLRGKNQWGLFAVTKLTLYVADIQTTQTATHSMDPTHSHQGHKPKIRNSINIHECWHG